MLYNNWSIFTRLGNIHLLFNRLMRIKDMEEKRFIDIETKLLHLESILDDLHHVLYGQQATIDILLKKLKRLEDQMQAQNEIRPAEERPPHY